MLCSTQTASLPIPLNILAGQTLAQLEDKAAAAAALLKAATAKDEKPSTTTTTKTTTTVETVVVTTGTQPPPPVVPTPPAPSPPVEVKPKKDDADVVVDGTPKPEGEENTAVINTPTDESVKKGLTDPADHGSVFLGLRVYTNRDAPAVVGGQLRHEMNTSFAGLALASV